MNDNHKQRNGLPREASDRLTQPFLRFLQVETAAGALLLCFAVVALALANSPWSYPFLAFWETPVGVQWGEADLTRSLRHWINDGLMTLFFFVVALELKREFVLGELRDLRTAALPLAAALGGMAVPVLVYLLIMDGQPGTHGWGTVMATDTAFVIGGLALFGKAIPSSLRIFLVSLAIFDDVGAILVVAIGYGHSLDWAALGLAAGFLMLVLLCARTGIRSVPVFFLVGGATWLSFDASGLHATITGVILGIMTPARAWVDDERMRALIARVTERPRGERWSGNTSERWDLRQAGRAIEESLSPLERLEITLHPWVGFAIMPLFALANAGVAVSGVRLGETLTVAIIAGLVVGKPVGVLLFSWIAIRLRLATLAASLDWRFMTAGACLTGVGFTMSIFIADLAYAPGLVESAKVGIFLASALAAATGLSFLTWRIFRQPTARRMEKQSMVRFSKNAHDDGIMPTGVITPESGIAGPSFHPLDRGRRAPTAGAPTPGLRGIGSWENEGGALGSTGPETLPEGVIAETVTRYRVGSHVYGKLDDALAEQRRRDRRRS